MSKYLYCKTKDGYVRYTTSLQDTFIHTVLTCNSNRTIKHKFYEHIVCWLFGHVVSSVVVVKGYSHKLGTFNVSMCDKCRREILFYEGGIK